MTRPPSLSPSSAADRAQRAERNTGAPTEGFTGSTPYDDYVGSRTLHSLMRPVTDDPAEPAFLVISQVMELLFGLLRTEWTHVQHCLRDDDLSGAISGLRRSRGHLRCLNSGWDALSFLTPTEFNRFRDALGEASGFQSSGYRHVEFLLGLKDETRLRPHRGDPEVHAELEQALHAPSLYDDVVAYLHRHGFGITAEAVERDHAQPWELREDVEAAWVQIYADAQPANLLFELAEQLTEVADEFTTWRHRHVMAVRRAMGAKPGSGGSPGLTWLQRSLARDVFPELWSARTVI